MNGIYLPLDGTLETMSCSSIERFVVCGYDRSTGKITELGLSLPTYGKMPYMVQILH